MRRATIILAFILLSMNVSLLVHGAIGGSEFLGAYPSTPSGFNVNDLNSIDQNNLRIVDANGSNISTGGTDFVSGVLDFVESIPVVGSILTLFRFAFDFMLNATFGITFLMLELQLPMQYVILVGIINFAIVTMGVLELVFSFTASRGGVR